MKDHMNEEAIVAVLKELAATTPAPDDPAMEAALRTAFRASHAADRSLTIAPPRSLRVRHWSAMAAAAVFVIAAAIIWYPAPQRPPAPSPTKPAPPAPRPRPSTEVIEMAAAPTPAPVVRERARPVEPDSQWDSFMVLPGMASLPDLESGRVLRVEVPVAALPAYGLDIVPDTLPAAIEADLLVGQDGMPRAIRLASARPISRE